VRRPCFGIYGCPIPIDYECEKCGQRDECERILDRLVWHPEYGFTIRTHRRIGGYGELEELVSRLSRILGTEFDERLVPTCIQRPYTEYEWFAEAAIRHDASLDIWKLLELGSATKCLDFIVVEDREDICAPGDDMWFWPNWLGRLSEVVEFDRLWLLGLGKRIDGVPIIDMTYCSDSGVVFSADHPVLLQYALLKLDFDRYKEVFPDHVAWCEEKGTYVLVEECAGCGKARECWF